MRSSRGFTLIELSIILTIITIIAVVAIPSLLNALDRGRQGGTVGDLRSLGTALERYAADHYRYPEADDMEALRDELQPIYIKKLPLTDGWDHPFVYEVDEEGSTYTLRSPGKDGELQDEPLADATHDFNADIVLVDGVFVQRPAGEQS